MIKILINFAEKEEDFPLLEAASIIIIRTYGVILWLQALFERWVTKQSKIVFVFNNPLVYISLIELSGCQSETSF